MNSQTVGRLAWITVMLVIWVPSIIGCPQHSVPATPTTKTNMNTDVSALKRFINLPTEVSACSWQTEKFPRGNDWWFCAVLEFDGANANQFFVAPTTEVKIDFPASLELTPPFDSISSLKGFGQDDKGAWCVAESWSMTPFESSPLLNGHVIKIGDNKAIVYAWTQ